jgi:hypothetical protein
VFFRKIVSGELTIDPVGNGPMASDPLRCTGWNTIPRYVPSGGSIPPTFDAKNLIAVMAIKQTGVAHRAAAESFQPHPHHASGLELNHFVDRS